MRPIDDEKAIEIVRNYIMEHLDRYDLMPDFHLYIVWKCKVLQNWKYLISSTLFDGMYYELTYNGDKHEWYLIVFSSKGDKIYVKRSDCFGCHYNDGGVHAECIVCDKAENRKEFSDEDDSTVPAHWIDQGHKIFKCSNCGNYLDFRGVNAGRGAVNYCPNCGAKMWNILTRKPPKRSQS